MENKISTVQAKETFKQAYSVDNDTCPVCGKKMTTLSNIVKIGKAAFHMQCYLDAAVEIHKKDEE